MSLNYALSELLFIIIMSAMLVFCMSADLLTVTVISAVLGGILLTSHLKWYLLWLGSDCVTKPYSK